MRLKTISKELEEIIALVQKKDRKFLDRLKELKARIDYKIAEEETKEFNKNPAIYPLVKWYTSLWDGKIPEGNHGRIAKVFKELLEDFKIEPDEIKELYQFWLELEDVPVKLKKQYAILLTAKETRGIVDFRGKLRYIKGLKRELEGSSWVSKEFKHPEDSYSKNIIDADDLDVFEDYK